jgi:D-serine dehydratase
MLATDLPLLLIPIWILLGLVVLLGILGLLGRIQGGRYLKPLFGVMAKVPFLKRQMEKASKAAIERTNPELASAMRKLEPHAKQLHDPQQAQKAMSRLTRQERAALLEMQEQQGGIEPEVMNRQMRRRLEKQQKRR